MAAYPSNTLARTLPYRPPRRRPSLQDPGTNGAPAGIPQDLWDRIAQLIAPRMTFSSPGDVGLNSNMPLSAAQRGMGMGYDRNGRFTFEDTGPVAIAPTTAGYLGLRDNGQGQYVDSSGNVRGLVDRSRFGGTMGNAAPAPAAGSGGDALGGFMSNASWTNGMSADQVRTALGTITPDDYAKYAPDQQARIRGVLGFDPSVNTYVPGQGYVVPYAGAGKGFLPGTQSNTPGAAAMWQSVGSVRNAMGDTPATGFNPAGAGGVKPAVRPLSGGNPMGRSSFDPGAAFSGSPLARPGGNPASDVGLGAPSASNLSSRSFGGSAGGTRPFFTNGYANGGRVTGKSMGAADRDSGSMIGKRAPVTIDGEYRYADGGPVVPTYQDYLAAYRAGDQSAFSESGGSNQAPPMSESDWSALSDADKWKAGRSGALDGSLLYRLPQNNPLYQQLEQQTGAEPGRVVIGYGQVPHAGDRAYWNDPSKVVDLGNGTYAYAENNQSPQWEHQMHPTSKAPGWWLAAAAAMGGLAAATATGAIGGADAAAGGAAAGAADTPLMIAPGMATQATAENALLNAGILPGSAEWTSALASAGLDTTAGGLYPGASDVGLPSGDESAGLNMGPSNDGIPDTQGLPGSGDPGAEVAPPGTGAYDPSLPAYVQGSPSKLSQLADWITKNPTQAARIFGGAANLIVSASRRGGSGQHVPLAGPPGGGSPDGSNGGAAGGAVSIPSIPGAAASYTGVDPNFDPRKYLTTGDLSNYRAARGEFMPIESLLLDEATRAGSPAEMEAAAGRAGVDVARSYADSERARKNALIAQGLNPDSGIGPGAELDRLSALDRAKAMAGAKNQARLAERNRGYTEKMGASQLGAQIGQQGLSADTMGQRSQEANLNAISNIGLNDMNNRARLSTSDADRAARLAETSATLAERAREANQGSAFDYARLNADIASGNRTADRQDQVDTGRGIGSVVSLGSDILSAGHGLGWWNRGGRVDVGLPLPKKGRGYRDGARVRVKSYDNGGEVSGPGTSTSDSVRARLSDGEHVLNAEGTQLADEMYPGFLDDLNHKGLMIREARAKLREATDVGLGV